MITPRKLGEYITYSNQDFDELVELRLDLQAHPKEYLNHTDGFVRSEADWAMEYYKMRNIRGDVAKDTKTGWKQLQRLYARLQQVQSQ